MPTLASELARLAGPKCKEIVSATIHRWEDKIRERIRLEMALKLAEESALGRQVQRVAIVLTDALPLALVPYEEELTTTLTEVAGMFRRDRQSFKESATALQQLLRRLGILDAGWSNRTNAETGNIEAVQNLADELLELAAGANFGETLTEIDEDLLGAYFPLGKELGRSRTPVIEIYWAVIGSIAKTIEVDLEGLTLVVLTHELAHAYSHLGADTDGNRWEDRAFCQSEIRIKEGLAQYYTEKVMRWLEQRHIGSPYHAFAELLKVQAPPYRIHEEWSKEFSPEILRAAIIECRNNHVTKTDHFIGLMGEAKRRLVGRR